MFAYVFVEKDVSAKTLSRANPATVERQNNNPRTAEENYFIITQ